MVRYPNISKSKPFPRRNPDDNAQPENTNKEKTLTEQQNREADDVVVSNDRNNEQEFNPSSRDNNQQYNQDKDNHQTEDEDEI